MKPRAVSILILLFGWLWLSGGWPDPCQAQRLTASGRSRTAAAPSVRLLKLPLSRKVDSVLHHIRAYPQATAEQQRRYARELVAHFAPSGYISVRQADGHETRLSVPEYLSRFGRQSVPFRFGGAEMIYYGQAIETAPGSWQMSVTTYRNALTFAGNKPHAADLTTVLVPVESPPPVAHYWQVFTLYLISTNASLNP